MTITASKVWLFCAPYLVRYGPSGVYYMRVKVAGRIIRKSLKTKAESAALRLLPVEIKKARSLARREADGGLTVADCALAYFANLKGTIKPRSLDYREETWKALRAKWPGLETRIALDVSKNDCEAWARKARTYSATRFNGCLQTLRGILSVAGNDPTTEIQPAKVRIIAPNLPTQKQFGELLKYLRADPRRRATAFTIRLLAFTGLRFDEARNLERSDVDLKSGRLLVRVTKNGEPRHVPIIGDARPTLQEFIKGTQMTDPRKVLQTFAKHGGFRITPHGLRHLFATRCIESGVDVRTLSAWLGHKDGGKLLLQRYSHLRDSHSQAMAKKVRFRP